MRPRFLQGAAGWLAGEFISTWVWAPVITAGGAVIGWAENESWFHLYVGTALLFAAVSGGMLWFSGWRQSNRVEDKIRHAGMRINVKQVKDRIATIQFGFNLQSTASFALDFKVLDLSTKITLSDGNRELYPPKREYNTDTVKLAPGAVGFYEDHEIPLPENYHGNNNVVELKCKVLYGKTGRFNHNMELKKKTFLNFVGSGISGGQHWYDQ